MASLAVGRWRTVEAATRIVICFGLLSTVMIGQEGDDESVFLIGNIARADAAPFSPTST
ncbi:MAG: hypothetical protein ABIZ64_14200 [Casimicrobium sp.]